MLFVLLLPGLILLVVWAFSLCVLPSLASLGSKSSFFDFLLIMGSSNLRCEKCDLIHLMCRMCPESFSAIGEHFFTTTHHHHAPPRKIKFWDCGHSFAIFGELFEFGTQTPCIHLKGLGMLLDGFRSPLGGLV